MQFRVAHAHTLPSFSFKWGRRAKAGSGGCFFSFPFEILAGKPESSRSLANGLQLLHPAFTRPQKCFGPSGLVVLSHRPCHDSSVNLKPSFTRQGSVELIAHQTLSWLFQHLEKKLPDGCVCGAAPVINSRVIAKHHWILFANYYKRKRIIGLQNVKGL